MHIWDDDLVVWNEDQTSLKESASTAFFIEVGRAIIRNANLRAPDLPGHFHVTEFDGSFLVNSKKEDKFGTAERKVGCIRRCVGGRFCP